MNNLTRRTCAAASQLDWMGAPVSGPTLEDIMTSVFLFGCHFCKNTHNAAKVRLRVAAALAEVMGLYDPASYERVSADEKDCRARTLVVLTVIER